MTYWLEVYRVDSGYDVGFDVDFDELGDAITSCKGLWDMFTPESKRAFTALSISTMYNRIRVHNMKGEVLYDPTVVQGGKIPEGDA